MKVAIFQNTITGGGRMVVVNEMIRVLNSRGVVPDVYTLRVNRNYVKPSDLQFEIHKMLNFVYGFYELKIVFLNFIMNLVCRNYDLLINSNNSFLYTPKFTPTISYVHFPRKYRVLLTTHSLGFPDLPFIDVKLIEKLKRRIMQVLYKHSYISGCEEVIANSRFTAECISKVYPSHNIRDIKVLYPPVSRVVLTKEKEDFVLTLGRYCDEKRQLEQIKIAQVCPSVRFCIAGFVGDKVSKHYFEECKKFVHENNLHNVELLTNVSIADKKLLLRKARYFLHTQRNEPFGLAVAESIMNGCIPLVNDSGGPRELVPYDNLRFNGIEEAKEKIVNFIAYKVRFEDFNFGDLIDNYSQEAFITSFDMILEKYF